MSEHCKTCIQPIQQCICHLGPEVVKSHLESFHGKHCNHDLDVSPSGKYATCRLCSFVGKWRDGIWERVPPAAGVQNHISSV